jgi:hypothetical protein
MTRRWHWRCRLLGKGRVSTALSLGLWRTLRSSASSSTRPPISAWRTLRRATFANSPPAGDDRGIFTSTGLDLPRNVVVVPQGTNPAAREVCPHLDDATRRRYIGPGNQLSRGGVMANRFTPVLARSLGWALVLTLACAPSTARAADPAAEGLKFDRVVMLMRHGIRPPTKAPIWS